MAKRVRTGSQVGQPPNIFADLALLGSLTNDQEGEIAPQDLVGASQDPVDFQDIVGTPKYGDVRQNPNPDEYLDNLRKISQLPMAMSDDSELRQDALENMRSPATLPNAIQEEQLEGLSGEQGAAQSGNTEVGFDTSMIPRNKAGQLQDPLEFLRMRVQEDPSLLEQLPEETRQRLASIAADPERGFVPPQEEQEPEKEGLFDRFGRALSMQAQMGGIPSPKSKVPPVPQAETTPPPPPEAPAPTPIVPPEQPITPEMVETHPEQRPQAGAMQMAQEDPQIVKDLQDLAGGPIPADVQSRADQWEAISSKQKEDWNAEEAALMQKAEAGTLSTFDKVALGIAIAVPILIALRYGSGAGLVAAGEGLKGFSGSVNSQMKERSAQKTANKERVDEIRKQRIQLEEKDIEMNKKILDSIPDKAAREFMKNKKTLRQFGDVIGIPTGDEQKALWLDAGKFDASDDGVKHARQIIKDADETIGIMRDSNKTINEALDILDQLPQGTGVWDAIKKNAQWFTSAGGANPFGGKGPQIDVVGPDGKTRKIDAFSQLKQKINVLQDLYNKQILGGTRLTGNVVTHWGGILGDPSRIQDWLSQDLNSFKDTTRSLKDIMNSREVESLVGKGFVRQPLEAQFPSSQDQILESDENVFNQMRANPQAFKNKVK